MKRVYFVFFFLVTTLVGAQSQDTVIFSDVRDLGNCYIPSVWPQYPDDFTYNDFTKTFDAQLFMRSQNHQQQTVWGFRMYTGDTLNVYGLAAVVCMGNTMNDWNGGAVYGDTSSLHAYTWLMLFAAESDSLRQLVDTSCTYVHAWQRPQYYVKPNWGLPEYVVLPLYERFFPSVVTVTDSFYLGNLIQREHWINHSSDIMFVHVMTDLIPPYTCDTVDVFERVHWEYHNTMYERDEDYWTANWSGIVPKQHPLFFPIIAPPDTTPLNPNDTVVVNPADTLVVLPGDTLVIGGDTLVNSGDTLVIIPGEPFVIGGDTLVVNPGDTLVVIPGSAPLSLQQSDFVYRYTALQPNPATDQVRVTSSFGISRIEAYDLRGRLIKEFSIPNSQFSINLDVSSWPRGTYLLRITTPAGTTTKKLLIR